MENNKVPQSWNELYFPGQICCTFSVQFDTRENWLGGKIGNTNICELQFFIHNLVVATLLSTKWSYLFVKKSQCFTHTAFKSFQTALRK
jgi:hypothetical protein